MVTTTLAVLTIIGALNTGASPSPGWQTDYAQALVVASADRKPMAVFIGHGTDKISQLFADGSIPSESARLLREQFVCVYLNTDTPDGLDISKKLQISEGLVISSPGGDYQALRHNGTLAGVDLTQKLGQLARAGQPVTTVTTGPVAASVQTGALAAPAFTINGCANGNCRIATTATPVYGAPVTQSFPGTIVSYPTQSFGFPTSSCPNGRCPNQR